MAPSVNFFVLEKIGSQSENSPLLNFWLDIDFIYRLSMMMKVSKKQFL